MGIAPRPPVVTTRRHTRDRVVRLEEPSLSGRLLQREREKDRLGNGSEALGRDGI